MHMLVHEAHDRAIGFKRQTSRAGITGSRYDPGGDERFNAADVTARGSEVEVDRDETLFVCRPQRLPQQRR
jgi:hypothetical protein